MITYLKKTSNYVSSKTNIAHNAMQRLNLYQSYYFSTNVFPECIKVAVNNDCCLKCTFCDIGQRNVNEHSYVYKSMKLSEKSYMQFDLFKKFIESVKQYKPTINFALTEPLMHDQIIEFVGYAKQNGLTTIITSNGYNLPKFTDKLAMVGVNQLNFSIDGTEEIHDTLRGVQGSYRNVINGIKEINKIKKRDNLIHPIIDISTVVCDINYRNLSNIVEVLSRETEADSHVLNFLHFIPKHVADKHNKICPQYPVTESSVDEVDTDTIDIDIMAEEIRKINKLKKNLKTKITFHPHVEEKELEIYYKNPELFLNKFKKCDLPWRFPTVYPDGTVKLFFRCICPEIGNINQKSMLEIWNDNIINEFRTELKKRGHFPACSRCSGLWCTTVK